MTVAPVTSTVRGAPTEVSVGVEEGLKQPSCVNLCNLFTVPRGRLKGFVGTLGPDKIASAMPSASDRRGVRRVAVTLPVSIANH